MALTVPLRYINDGEVLNEITLNRALLDAQTNLEDLFNRVDAYDPGTSEAEANRVVLRDGQGTAKFGTPSHDEHPWRLAEYQVFYEFLLDNEDFILLDRLRKASTTQIGVVQLDDTYSSSTSVITAPTSNALKAAYDELSQRIDDLEDDLNNFPVADTSGTYGITTLADTIFPGDNRETLVPTPKAVHDYVHAVVDAIEMPTIYRWTNVRDDNPSVTDYGLANETDYVASYYAVRRVLEEVQSLEEDMYSRKTVGTASAIGGTAQGAGAYVWPGDGGTGAPEMKINVGFGVTGGDGTVIVNPLVDLIYGYWYAHAVPHYPSTPPESSNPKWCVTDHGGSTGGGGGAGTDGKKNPRFVTYEVLPDGSIVQAGSTGFIYIIVGH